MKRGMCQDLPNVNELHKNINTVRQQDDQLVLLNVHNIYVTGLNA